MTHNEATHVDGAAEAVRSGADDATATRALGQLPTQSEAPPPPLMPLRRRKLPIATMALAIAAAGGVGFYSGVRVEKGQIKTTGNTGSNAAAFAFGNAANARTGARTNTTPSPAASGAPGAARGTGAGGNGAAGSGAGSASGGSANLVGTVTVVDGNTLYVTETNGDTVKVTTSDGTTVTKTVTGTVKDLAPGESVIIRGVQSSQGVYAAQSVTQASSTAGLVGGFGGGAGGGFGGGRANRSGAGATTTPKSTSGS
ncbi:MAG: hypothetical protein ACRDV3_09525 [Acidothermaceae bacterium]